MMKRCLALLAVMGCATTPQPSAEAAAPPVPAAPEPPAAAPAPRDYTAADVEFMSGMIAHHAQAVLIAGWAPTHDAGASVQGLSERIVVAQNDEIAMMQRWLRDRGEHAPEPDPRGHKMPGMDHYVLMPGMLTPAQLAQLDSARGRQFDRLFLKLMIQHHQGAISMVEQLLRAPGAAENGPVFRLVADVNADQTTEINRMQLMLEALERSPE
jgi:uncharacterized protein (DUF305 family)